MNTLLITGCSSGFGQATAQHFLNNGWNVIAAMRTPQADILKGDAARLRVIPLDVTDARSVQEGVAEAIGAFGGVDVLVNNAGVGFFAPLETTSDETIRHIFQTNAFGVMAMIRAIVPHMRERGSGVIVNVTSSSTFAPAPLTAVYAASKTAVDGLSEALYFELAPFGIRVKMVEPGYGTQSLHRTKASLIYKATDNLRAIQILLGQSKNKNIVRYLGVDVDGALPLSRPPRSYPPRLSETDAPSSAALARGNRRQIDQAEIALP